MDRSEAREFLRERFAAQAAKYPKLHRIGEHLYVTRNLRRAMKLSAESIAEIRKGR